MWTFWVVVAIGGCLYIALKYRNTLPRYRILRVERGKFIAYFPQYRVLLWYKNYLDDDPFSRSQVYYATYAGAADFLKFHRKDRKKAKTKATPYKE